LQRAVRFSLKKEVHKVARSGADHASQKHPQSNAGGRTTVSHAEAHSEGKDKTKSNQRISTVEDLLTRC